MKLQSRNIIAVLIVLILNGCGSAQTTQVSETNQETNTVTNAVTDNSQPEVKVDGYNYSGKSLGTKAIQLRPITDQESKAPPTTTDFVQLKVSALKKSYKVGENIHFMVKGNQNYYLYVYAIDYKSDDVLKLIPNEDTVDHHLLSNKNYEIPKTVHFSSDSVGKERVIFMGTKAPLPDEQLKKIAGKFATAKASDVQNTLSQIDKDYAESFDPDYNAKSIVITKLSDGSVKPVPSVINLTIE